MIFSNHSPIGAAKTDESYNRALVQQTGRTGGFVESVGLPFQIFVATAPVPRKSQPPSRSDPPYLPF